MAWPNRSVWSSIDALTAWWYTGVSIIGNSPFAAANICQTIGPAVVVQLQMLLRDALAPGWTPPDVTDPQPARPVVNGFLDDGTLSALAAYAAMLGDTASADMIPEIQDAAGEVGQPGAKATPSLTRYILWVTYYRKSVAVSDGGTRTTKAATLGDLAPDQIFFPVLDLSDEEVSCINKLRTNSGDRCTTLFEEVGSSDAKFLPLTKGVGDLPASLITSLAGAQVQCAKFKAWQDSFLSGRGNAPLNAASQAAASNELIFMAWRNWVLAQAGGARKPTTPGGSPLPTAGTSAAGTSTATSGSVPNWLWLAILGGVAYGVSRD